MSGLSYHYTIRQGKLLKIRSERHLSTFLFFFFFFFFFCFVIVVACDVANRSTLDRTKHARHVCIQIHVGGYNFYLCRKGITFCMLVSGLSRFVGL